MTTMVNCAEPSCNETEVMEVRITTGPNAEAGGRTGIFLDGGILLSEGWTAEPTGKDVRCPLHPWKAERKKALPADSTVIVGHTADRARLESVATKVGVHYLAIAAGTKGAVQIVNVGLLQTLDDVEAQFTAATPETPPEDAGEPAA